MPDQSNSNKQLMTHPTMRVSNNPPTTPTMRVSKNLCIKLGFDRSLSLSPELRTLRDQVFTALPQDPHYEPLRSYCSSVREGMKLGLDVAFLDLVQKIHDVVGPVKLLEDLKEFIAQLTQLEEMGYDVSKLWDRFDALRRIANQDKASGNEMAQLEAEAKDKRVKVGIAESRILELETQIKTLRAGLKAQKSDLKNLDCKTRKLKEESRKKVDQFASIARAPWY